MLDELFRALAPVVHLPGRCVQGNRLEFIARFRPHVSATPPVSARRTIRQVDSLYISAGGPADDTVCSVQSGDLF